MRRSSVVKISLLLLVLVTIAVVYGQRDILSAAVQTNPYRGDAASVARGELLWTLHCVSCHGPEAVGDGPASALLPKRPKDLTMIAPAPIFPDGIVAFRISQGKNTMPAWQDVLQTEQIWDLVSFIRSKSRR